MSEQLDSSIIFQVFFIDLFVQLKTLCDVFQLLVIVISVRLLTEPDSRNLPKFVPIGFDKLDIDVVITGAYLTSFAKGCISYLADPSKQ